MLKMTIDNEEVVSKNNFTIKEEMLSPSSTILNNTYPKTWENDKDYTSRFYYPKDYAKLDIQNFSITPEEAGTTIQVNGSATLTDVDTTKESRVLSLKGQTSQTTTTTGKNLFNKDTITDGYRLDGSGVPSGAASNEFTSDFIEISPSTQYVRSTGGINAYTRTCFYDSSKTFISKDDSNQTFTTPSNAKYLKFSEYTSRLDTMQLEKGSTPTAYEPFIPNSPSPDYPQPVNVVSGDNEINICGKNLVNPNNLHLGYSLNDQGALLSNNPSRTALYQISVVPNTQFNLSTSANYQIGNLFYYDINKTYLSTQTSSYDSNKNTTTPNNAYYISFVIRRTDNGTMTQSDIEALHTQIEKGNQATTYEPYIGNTYPIYLGVENRFNTNSINQGQYNANAGLTNIRIAWYGKQVVSGETMTVVCNNSDLRFAVGRTTMNTNNSSNVFSQDSGWQTGTYTITYNGSGYACIIIAKVDNTNISTSAIVNSDYTISYNGEHISTTPIELCKIGTYQDYIYKDNGSWYLHKEIGKVVLDGSENWQKRSDITAINAFVNNNYVAGQFTTNGQGFSNYFQVYTSGSNNVGLRFIDTIHYGTQIQVGNDIATNYTDFKTWLTTHNVIVYYILRTPTTTEITNTTLLEQLDDLESQ